MTKKALNNEEVQFGELCSTSDFQPKKKCKHFISINWNCSHNDFVIGHLFHRTYSKMTAKSQVDFFFK